MIGLWDKLDRPRRAAAVWAAAGALGLAAAAGAALAQGAAPVDIGTDAAGTVHVPAQDAPFSGFASEEARHAFIALGDQARAQAAHPTTDLATIRQGTQTALDVLVARSRALYPVTIKARTIGGVYTDVITPKGGLPARNRRRVLINLHGGGFFTGARVTGLVEGIPIAGIGKMQVVAVDYRQGPENKFPAASEDVASVYRVLLKHYPANNIGIYGCSAGGLLTAEVAAWLQKTHLPRPGAIGIFCASASGWAGGDSTLSLSSYGAPGKWAATPHAAVSDSAYFADADINDPLVAPIRSPAVMARFPPTLVITGSRDVSMSSAIHTHARLVKLGVDADLHVWEGVGHGFFYDPSLPESKEAFSVIAHFFDRHLGR